MKREVVARSKELQITTAQVEAAVAAAVAVQSR
jgi:hypothetical protein